MGYILIGASTGGPKLIEKLCLAIPSCFKHTICIVQHMQKDFTNSFAKNLNELSSIEVIEAYNDLKLSCSKIIIAKGGVNLGFKEKYNNFFIELSQDKSDMFVPSVDEMFLSASEVLPPKEVMAIVLTGIGDDGAKGLLRLKEKGAYTIVQDKDSSPVYGMPYEALKRGGANKVLSFDEILKEILRYE